MKKYKGSYTVEASMVMPFLIVIFCVILYGIFYIHDLCVIKIYTARAAQECSWAAVENAASLVPKDEDSILSYIHQKYYKELCGQMLMLSVSNFRGQIRHNTLTQSYNVQWDVAANPLSDHIFNDLGSLLDVSYRAQAQRTFERHLIYHMDLLKEVIE